MRKSQRVKMKAEISKGHRPMFVSSIRKTRDPRQRLLSAKQAASFTLVKLEHQDSCKPASLTVIFIVATVIVATSFLISIQVSCLSNGQTVLIAQRYPQSASAPDLDRLINLLLRLNQQIANEKLLERSQPEGPSEDQHLRNLLARPRNILSSFVPQLLQKQFILKRPRPRPWPLTSKLRVEENGKVPTRSSTALTIKPSSQVAEIDSRSHQPLVAQSPIMHKFGGPPPPTLNENRSGSIEKMIVGPPKETSVDEARPQVVFLHEVSPANAIMLEPLALGTQEQKHNREDRNHFHHLPQPAQGTDAEQGLEQIDELIKREFESRMHLNEQVVAWQGQTRAGGNNSRFVDEQSTEESHYKPVGQIQPNDFGRLDAASNGETMFLALPTRQFESPNEELADNDQPQNEAHKRNGTIPSTSMSLASEQDSWRPTDYPPIRQVDRQQEHEQHRQQPFTVDRKLRHSQMQPIMRATVLSGRPSVGEHLVAGQFVHESRPQIEPPTLQHLNPASVFVPSALETIAQLRLNQTNQRHQQVGDYGPMSSLDFAIQHSLRQMGAGQEPAPAAVNQQRQTSLVNGKPMSSVTNYEAMASENHLNQHKTRSFAASATRNAWPSQELNKAQSDGQDARLATPNDLRDTLKRLRETKARIRQLQAELNATRQPMGFLTSAAESNKTLTQYAGEQTGAVQSQGASGEPQAANLRGASQQGASGWFQSPWSLSTDRGASGSLFVPARMIHAHQSMNMPLGLYHKGPLTTPARLVASALGSAVHHSAGQQQDWSAPARPLPTTSGPKIDLHAPVRPSSGPILLSSTISVAGDADLEPATTLAPELSPNETTHLIDNKTTLHQRRPPGKPLETTTNGDDGQHRPPNAEGEVGNEPLTSGQRLHNSGRSNVRASSQDAPITTVEPSAGPTMPTLITSSPQTPVVARSDIPKPAEGGDQRPHQHHRLQTPFMHNDGGHLIQQLDHLDKSLSTGFHQHARPPTATSTPATESPIVIVEPALSGNFHSHSQASKPIGLTRAAIGSGRHEQVVEITDKVNSTRAEGESERQQQPEDRQVKSKRQQSGSESGNGGGGNFFGQLANKLIGLFATSSARSAADNKSPPSKESVAPPKVAPLGSKSLANHRQLMDSRVSGPDSAVKLTTERVVHSLIVIICSLALVTMLVVLALVRCQQVRRSKRQTLASDSNQEEVSGTNKPVFVRLTECSGAKLQHGAACPAGLDWRRLAPISLIAAEQQRRQQNQQTNKIILDGTMRNVSLLARHRLSNELCLRESLKSQTNGGSPPLALVNRSCGHCIACSESWLCRADEAPTGPFCPASGFCHARGKLPFGAASSVNNMLQRGAAMRRSSTRVGANRGQRPDKDSNQDEVIPKSLSSGPGQPMACSQRIPIGGTRLRMMTAIEEQLSRSGAAPDDDQLDHNCAGRLTSGLSDAGDFNTSCRQHQCSCNKSTNCQPHQQAIAGDCCSPEDGAANDDQSSSFIMVDQLHHRQRQNHCSERFTSGQLHKCQHSEQELGSSLEQAQCHDAGEAKDCNNCNCCKEN